MRPLSRVALAGVFVALVLSACGSAGIGGVFSRGRVAVLYAGSLARVIEGDLGPAFTRGRGYAYEGVGAGSNELAAQIEGGIGRGDVFVSASPRADASLEGAAGGDHVSWYAAFAEAPLVIGYDPHSRFASRFRSRPWYRVIAEPGIRVGTTDPKLDPKGQLTLAALRQAASVLHEPWLARAPSGFAVFPEESLVGRLQAGQLDAGFFYADEARGQGIPAVSLKPAEAAATYTVTVLNGAADAKGAQAFVAFLLGGKGRAILASHGLTVLRPALSGPATAVPAALRALLVGG